MITIFQTTKVNNEIEWCEITDPSVKDLVEKALLKNRVSYCINWNRPKLFSADKRERCVFCVNALQKEAADEAFASLSDDVKSKVVMVNKKVEKVYY